MRAWNPRWFGDIEGGEEGRKGRLPIGVLDHQRLKVVAGTGTWMELVVHRSEVVH
jgi:hypothetical protein